MGSVHYLAPELVRGKPASPRSDVYGLGVVLYEMASGRVPFTADTDLAIALAHVEETPPAPRTFNAHLDPDLERIILRCLAKPPEARYASAAEVAEDLRTARGAANSPRTSTAAYEANGTGAPGLAPNSRPPIPPTPAPPTHAQTVQSQPAQAPPAQPGQGQAATPTTAAAASPSRTGQRTPR